MAQCLRVRGQFVARATFAERGKRRFGAEHPGLHRVVHALDPRHVEKSRAVADERAAGKDQPGDRLQSAFVDRPRAIADTLAAVERATDCGMRLEALELVEG